MMNPIHGRILIEHPMQRLTYVIRMVNFLSFNDRAALALVNRTFNEGVKASYPLVFNEYIAERSEIEQKIRVLKKRHDYLSKTLPHLNHASPQKAKDIELIAQTLKDLNDARLKLLDSDVLKVIKSACYAAHANQLFFELVGGYVAFMGLPEITEQQALNLIMQSQSTYFAFHRLDSPLFRGKINHHIDFILMFARSRNGKVHNYWIQKDEGQIIGYPKRFFEEKTVQLKEDASNQIETLAPTLKRYDINLLLLSFSFVTQGKLNGNSYRYLKEQFQAQVNECPCLH